MTYTITFKGKRFAPLDKEQEFALFEAMHRGDPGARDRIVNANIKFAAAVARNYEGHGLPIEDLVMEAGLGLLRAVDRFDHLRGIKFISYAVWWVKQGILTALAGQGRVVEVPPNRIGDLKKVDGARRRLEQRNARSATLPDIAEEIGFTLDKVEETLAILGQATSLDSKPEPEADVTLMDILIDPGADAGAAAELGMNNRHLQKLFSVLDPIDRAIVRRYFGIDRKSAETLQEIADDLGLTRERVRQRKEAAILRLQAFLRRLLAIGKRGSVQPPTSPPKLLTPPPRRRGRRKAEAQSEARPEE